MHSIMHHWKKYPKTFATSHHQQQERNFSIFSPYPPFLGTHTKKYLNKHIEYMCILRTDYFQEKVFFFWNICQIHMHFYHYTTWASCNVFFFCIFIFIYGLFQPVLCNLYNVMHASLLFPFLKKIYVDTIEKSTGWSLVWDLE